MKAEYDRAMEEFNRKIGSHPAFATDHLPNFSRNSPMRDAQNRKGVLFVDPQQPVLSVAPLNSMPYVGPPISSGDGALSPTERGTDPRLSNEPAVLFLPSCPDDEEWDNIIAATKMGVGLKGSAAMGKVGPIIGLMDVGESDDAYLFRVSLPGVATDRNKFSCNVEPGGKVVLKGVTSTGERIVRKHSQVFQMRTQNLSPPGPFSVSFGLPGPVDEQYFDGSFGVDGIFEGIVRKRQRTGQ
ncbi:Alpha-crystallin domain-containing protein [Actinidia chinensis var. chinensis]|uniref:Alpha-crystallin domain-containing protein n=1 Tax=Actinidia chinensis var. chinensis TaxID=1590841 RepID=A0A2R6R358_ACTCC|nr:Alpha-crystallin domain-containing protein [Actinidia chinensis var. chinensis]